jgi:hypothetical protein
VSAELVVGSKRVTARLDWAFRSRETNRITIAQRPNLPLTLFLVSVPLDWALSGHASAHKLVAVIGTICLGWWAIDEVARGVNPWRRVLGVAGTALVISRALALLR